jgi:hypothetical protein
MQVMLAQVLQDRKQVKTARPQAPQDLQDRKTAGPQDSL